MGRTASLITTDFSARNNVQMKMPHVLTSNHAVVLNQVEPVGVKWPYILVVPLPTGVHFVSKARVGCHNPGPRTSA